MFEWRRKLNKIILSISIILSIIIIGTIGYQILEGWSFIDSLFFTMITLSTVGYSLPNDMNIYSQIFTIALIISGLTIVIYSLSILTSFIVEGEIKNFMEGRKRMQKINKLTNHNILVGAGKTANYVIISLLKTNSDFVIIDKSEENITKLLTELGSEHIPYVVGDVKEENTLLYAGVNKSRNVILTLPDDVDNLYAALTVKTLNKNTYVVSKVNEPQNVKKMQYAGVDKIVLTSEIAGNRLAHLAEKPKMISFLDIINKVGDVEYLFEEIKIPDNSWMIDKTLKEIALPKLVDLIIIAIIKSNGNQNFNPSANEKIEKGDVIVVLGKEHKIQNLKGII